MILFRPVGLEELLLIYRSAMRWFPPRLPAQPIFYPVLNIGYAEQIARDWNTISGSMAGYVTCFEVDDEYVRIFPVQTVGGRQHQELWVPAEELAEFNKHIRGRIALVRAYFGKEFTGVVAEHGALRGMAAAQQLEALSGIRAFNIMDFHAELTSNHEAVYVNFPAWEQVESPVVQGVREHWQKAFPDVPVGVQEVRPT